MKLTETILHKAAPYPVVAFDVFDTLIKRDVARPTDLFALLGADFAKARTQAEAEARAAKSGEVTLAEIYARPCLTGYDPAAECAAEIACAVPNLAVLKAARALHAQGKRLYYISDMYLSKVQLDAMLAKCGYDFFDGGFVSADYGVQKRSGKLFRLFLQKTQTQAKEVLFIGDNWRADVAGSALAGIRSWHLPTQEVPRESLPAGAVAAFTANRLPGIESEAERLWLCHSRSAGCSLLPMAACPGTAAPQCQNPLSGAGYVPDAPGLRAFVPAGADRLLAGLPPQPVPASISAVPVGSAAGRSAAPIPYRCADRRLLRYRLPDGPARKIL